MTFSEYYALLTETIDRDCPGFHWHLCPERELEAAFNGREEIQEAAARLIEQYGHTPDRTGYTVVCTWALPPRPGRPGFFVIDPWTLVSIVPCRACGGRLLWAEAGYVPGYRICEGCGRPWLVCPGKRGEDTLLTIRVPETPKGPEWTWKDERDTSEEAHREYAELVSRFGGKPADYRVWKSRQ